ncbi:MAG: hypothetical protein RLY21_2452 [Planctomycetota bacterium]
MSQIPSVRSIREGLLEQARQTAPDAVALATVRQDLDACVRGVRKAIDRALDFASRGLVCEAASVIEDFPDLARQAEALRTLPSSDQTIGRIWYEQVGEAAARLPMPTQAEVDELAAITVRAVEHRALLDALRVSALRGEPIPARLRILKRLRSADQRNRMWLDQVEALENSWLKHFAELRQKPGATRTELDEALSALETHEWVASVPRGLREELHARVMPLRAGEAGERYATLAGEIHEAASLMDRAALLRLEEAWAKINLETGRMPEAALAASVAPAFAWLTNLENEERARAAFDAEVERLELMLNDARPSIEIERQVAVLRDARRDAPEGLVERALAFVEAERERLRRRHRLFLLAAASVAIVLGVVGVYLVQATSESRSRARELAALTAAVDADEADKAGAIATEIRGRGGEPDAALAAALVRADALVRTREARTAEIKRLVGDLSVELDRKPERARVLAIKDALAVARTEAEEPERVTIDGLERRRIDRLGEIDQEADRASRAAADAADAALKSWKLPSAWTDAAQVDPQEWARYLATLESTRQALEAAQSATTGFDTGVSRLALKIELVDARIAEAKSRAEALGTALRELDPVRLCAPVTLEVDFEKRLNDALTKHGAILARQQRLGDFETARDLSPAWLAIQTWRDDHRPKLATLLGPKLDGDASTDQHGRVLELLSDFLAKHPASPLTEAVKGVAARFDPTRAAEIWTAERVAEQLASARLADLEEVPLADGRRFYRRPAGGVDPRNRAVENLGDLMADPEKLDSILVVKREEMVGKPAPNEVSVAWTLALARLQGAAVSDVRPVLLDLLMAISASKSDPILRLRAMREGCDILEQSGQMPAVLAEPLRSWRTMLANSANEAVIADWARAGYEPEVNFRTARREAAAALERFPNLTTVLAESRAEQARAAGILQALVPWGVLEPADGNTPRVVSARRDSGRFFFVAKSGTGFEIAELAIKDGAVVSPTQLPKGPILVFRRLNP